MDLVTNLRELWRRRIYVAAALALALIVGGLMVFKVSPSGIEKRQYYVGVASARILVDTPDSQVVDLDPRGAEVLAARASLLANVLATGSVKSMVAQSAGLPGEKLAAVARSSIDPTAPPPAGQGAAPRVPKDGYSLISDADETLPIISIDTQAPTAKQAAKLADSTVVGLQTYLKSVASKQEIPGARQIVVSQMGPAQSTTTLRGPRRITALAAVIVIFLVSCAAILIVAGLGRTWRRAAVTDDVVLERFDADDGFFDQEQPAPRDGHGPSSGPDGSDHRQEQAEDGASTRPGLARLAAKLRA